MTRTRRVDSIGVDQQIESLLLVLVLGGLVAALGATLIAAAGGI